MGERIRLLMTIADLSGGGTERVFAGLLERLSRERFEIEACFWRPVFDYACPADVPTHVLDKHRPWHVFRTVRRLRDLIDRLRPDVVFSALFYTNLLTGEAVRRAEHRPRWVCRLGNPPRREARGLMRRWARRCLARADRVIGNSEGLSRAAVEYFGLDPDRVVTVHNGIDHQQIDRLAAEPLPEERSADTFVVAHAGRLTAQKNQSLLLRAFSRLRGR